MAIKNILDEISSEPSTNKKIEILTKYKDNDLLKRVLYLAYSKRVKFYIKQLPDYTYNQFQDIPSLEYHLNSLSKLSNREVTGNDAVALLTYILSASIPDDAYVIERIISKDLKIGMGSTNINKVFGDFIEDTPYMGAKSFSEKLAKEIVKRHAYSQTKMDGRYANAIIEDGTVTFESRSGEPNYLDGSAVSKELSSFENIVLNGEFTIDGCDRYTSNGIIASLISIGEKKANGEDVTKKTIEFEKEHGKTYQSALDSIVYTVWDAITLEEYTAFYSKTPYNIRLHKVSALVKGSKNVRLVETTIVNTYSEAINDFQAKLAAGLEGTILKAHDGVWKDGKPNHQCKMKLSMDVDLKIVGYNFGTKGTKNESVISSLIVESSCGRVRTQPTNMTEKVMKHITENKDKLIGSILECKCSGLSKDRDGNYSLLYPNYKELRTDKTTCDSLESIIEIENMLKGVSSADLKK